MAFISLVERQHLPPERVPGEYKWTPARVEWVYLKTERLTAKSRLRFHAEREKRLAKGEDVLVVTSTLKPDDKRFGINRQLRRRRVQLARRVMPRLRRQLERDRKRTEKLIGEEFAGRDKKRKKAEPEEERTEAGVILPKGVKKTSLERGRRKRGTIG